VTTLILDLSNILARRINVLTDYDDAMADAARQEYEIEKIEEAQIVYAVHKQGYYSHGVWGIYTDKNAAIKAAKPPFPEPVAL
jgi:hypothetical protein